MGRYIERSEHIARYTKEIYFSSLDAPIEESKQRKFVLESILFMNGVFDEDPSSEPDTLYKVCLDPSNSNSILSNITNGRENARGVRNTISTELWKVINQTYHFTNNYDEQMLRKTNLFDFTQNIIDQASLIRSKAKSTLLYDENWAIILLGVHIERAIQIIRIINSKLNDINKIENTGHQVAEISFEWSSLLRCCESFDMSKKFYGGVPNKEEVLEFMLLNDLCPKSIRNCLEWIAYYFEKVTQGSKQKSVDLEFQIGKLNAKYKYLTSQECNADIYSLLTTTQNKIMSISYQIESTYLSY